MKLKLISVTTLSALALSGLALANDPQDAGGDRGGRRGRGGHASLERMTDDLNLTPDQKAKIQPILDQARPQLEQIHREAMEKTKALMDNVRTQIRPMLTPEQQKKLDEMKNDRMHRRGDRGQHRHRGDGDDQNDSGDQ
jgi:protein CpxP